MDKTHINKGKLVRKPTGITDFSLLEMPLELIFTQFFCIREEEEGAEQSFVLTARGNLPTRHHHQANPHSHIVTRASLQIRRSPPWQYIGLNQTKYT